MSDVRREDPREELERLAFLLPDLVSSRLSHQLDQLCRAHGLTKPLYPVLWGLCLSETTDGVPLGSISDGLVTRASDVSRLVDRLEKLGLAERRPSSLDGRVVLVAATDAGRELFATLTVEIKELHRAQFASLEDGDLRTLIHILNRVLWSASEED